MAIVLTLVTQFIIRYVSSGLNPGDKFTKSPGIMRRIFKLENNVLYMDTYLDDEFGQIVLTTAAGLLPVGSIILQQSKDVQSDSISMEVRIHEMYHFLSVLKLFDPHFNTIENHVPEIVSETPPSFPQE